MEIEFGNFLELSDEQLEAAMTGMDAFVYAAGVDERVEFPAPVYDAYKKYNIDPVDRCLAMAKKCGVKRCVVLGSYFSWLAKTHPEMDLCAKHPYIRSRIDQEKVLQSMLMRTWALACWSCLTSLVHSPVVVLFGSF